MVRHQPVRTDRLLSICRLCSVTLVITLLHGTSHLEATPAADSAREYEVKAAMIYNFALFVEWPELKTVPESSPIVVGVLGEDPFGSVLETTFRNKNVRGRELQIQRFATLEKLRPCNILFVSQSERKRMSQIVGAIGRDGVLTIGDMKDFAELGGIISFKIGDDRVLFEINLEAAQRAGLKISSKLLHLATLHRPAAPRQE